MRGYYIAQSLFFFIVSLLVHMSHGSFIGHIGSVNELLRAVDIRRQLTCHRSAKIDS